MLLELFSAVSEPAKRLAKDATLPWTPPECLRAFDVVVDKEIVQDLIGSFVTDTAEQLCSLRRAMLAGDVVEFTRLTHSLKGISAQMGADQMAELCRQIEFAAGPASAEGYRRWRSLKRTSGLPVARCWITPAAIAFRLYAGNVTVTHQRWLNG